MDVYSWPGNPPGTEVAGIVAQKPSFLGLNPDSINS
jgi:hypothetical protein